MRPAGYPHYHRILTQRRAEAIEDGDEDALDFTDSKLEAAAEQAAEDNAIRWDDYMAYYG